MPEIDRRDFLKLSTFAAIGGYLSLTLPGALTDALKPFGLPLASLSDEELSRRFGELATFERDTYHLNPFHDRGICYFLLGEGMPCGEETVTVDKEFVSTVECKRYIKDEIIESHCRKALGDYIVKSINGTPLRKGHLIEYTTLRNKKGYYIV